MLQVHILIENHINRIKSDFNVAQLNNDFFYLLLNHARVLEVMNVNDI
jgi:hypothetical protein